MGYVEPVLSAVLTLVSQTDATDATEATDVCGADPGWWCEHVLDWTNGNETLAQLADWLIGRAFSLLVIFVAASLAAVITRRYFSRLVRRLIASHARYTAQQYERLGLVAPNAADEANKVRTEARAQSISAVVSSTATVIIWVIALLLMLSVVGVDLGPFLATAGIAGIALGFGAQTLVRDCLAGLFMLIEDQFGIGDSVDFGEPKGIVEQVALRATVLRDADGTVWHVPNGQVLRVANRSQLWAYALVDIEVPYDADIDRASTIALEAAAATCASDDWRSIALEPPQLLGVESLGPDGARVRIQVRAQPGRQWVLRQALRDRIVIELGVEGIAVAPPTRTSYLEDGDT